MSIVSRMGGIQRIRRLAVVTVALTAVVSALLFASIWLETWLTGTFLVKAELVVLVAVAIIYGLTAVLSFLGAAFFGLIWLRGRRKGKSQPYVARALLLCGSFVVAVVLAEAASAFWQNRRLGRMPVPVGGLPTTEDPGATWRIPASLELPELPTRFPDPPDDRTIDIAVLGESSAEGVPFHKWLSIGKVVGWQLEKVIPARPVRLKVLARSGDTLLAQHHALVNLEHRPELLIVYCGHNEFASRLFWSRDRRYYLDADQPGWAESLFNQAVGLSSVCGLIREEWNQCKIALPPAPIDKRSPVDLPAYTHVEYTALLADFRERLEAIVTYAHNLGSLVVLIAPPGNDAGYDPNRSVLPPATPGAKREEFARAVLKARLFEIKDLNASILKYRSLVAAQPAFAEVHYRLAQLLEKTGEWDEAYQHYVAARDCDGYPQRILSSFQAIYREVAARHDVILIDGQAYFHAIAHHGLLDDDLFQDAMHPSLRGEIALAQAVLQRLADRRAFGWPSECPAPIIDPGRCAAHFGIVPRDWIDLCKWGAGFYNMMAPLRYETAERDHNRRLYLQAQHRVESGDAPESVGLANIGIPRAVPLLSAADSDGQHAGRGNVPEVSSGDSGN
jgi:hypothetical protein